MKKETQALIRLTGMGLGAVCAGPLGAAAGGLAGGLIGLGLEGTLAALGTGASGVLTNLFSSRVEQGWREPYGGFNHDFRRSLLRALRSALRQEQAEILGGLPATYHDVNGRWRETLQAVFARWDAWLAEGEASAEKGDWGRLSALFPNESDEAYLASVDPAATEEEGGSASWARVYTEVLRPVAAEVHAPRDFAALPEGGRAFQEAVVARLRVAFAGCWAEEAKQATGRKAWIAFQKCLLQRMNRQLDAVFATATETQAEVGALRRETAELRELLARLADGAPDRPIGPEQEAFFRAQEERLVARVRGAVREEGELTRAHTSAEFARLREDLRNGLAGQTTAGAHDLPSPPQPFVGREEELAELTRLVIEGGAGVAIVGLRGMGGVGKTGLALMLAHRLRERFRFARYLNLQGLGDAQAANPTDRPLSHGDIVLTLLRSLGVAEADKIDPAQPGGLARLDSLLRAFLAAQPTLLLLDNATDGKQVAPFLLPAGGGSLLLVTARANFQLSGVSAKLLGVLPEPEAERLLSKLCPRLNEAEAKELALRCGRLPAALRAAAGRLALEEDWPVADYLRQLADERKRLMLIGGIDEEELDVQATLRLSLERLKPGERAVFARLAVFGPVHFDALAAAHVAEDEGNVTLRRLRRLSLVEWSAATRRYALHDLLRLLAEEELVEPARSMAAARHSEWYAAVVQTADQLWAEGGNNQVEAMKQFDREKEGIRRGQAWAGSHQPMGDESTVIYALSKCLVYRLGNVALPQWLDAGLLAAKRMKNRLVEAGILSARADMRVRFDSLDEADQDYVDALDIFREIGNRLGEANALRARADLRVHRGHLDEAEKDYTDALAIYQQTGQRLGEANIWMGRGQLFMCRDKWDEGLDAFTRALDLHKVMQDRPGEAADHGNLAQFWRLAGNRALAIQEGYEALIIFREIGDLWGQYMTLNELAKTYAALELRSAEMASAWLAWRLEPQLGQSAGAVEATAWFEKLRAGLTAVQRAGLEGELAEAAEMILELAAKAVRAAVEEAKKASEADGPTSESGG